MFPSFPRYKEGTGGRGQIEPGPPVVKQILACHFIHGTAKMTMSCMSHIINNHVFMICIFITFKLVYFTAVNLELHFKYKRF
jgi:hypothetical protein